MQTLGGASDRVPTVSTPGTQRPNMPMLTEPGGCTVAVVYLSCSGPLAAAARLVGRALGWSTPGGEHWSAAAGAANPMLQTSSAIVAATVDLRNRPGSGVMSATYRACRRGRRLQLT